jgi:hypothetical protein
MREHLAALSSGIAPYLSFTALCAALGFATFLFLAYALPLLFHAASTALFAAALLLVPVALLNPLLCGPGPFPPSLVRAARKSLPFFLLIYGIPFLFTAARHPTIFLPTLALFLFCVACAAVFVLSLASLVPLSIVLPNAVLDHGCRAMGPALGLLLSVGKRFMLRASLYRLITSFEWNSWKELSDDAGTFYYNSRNGVRNGWDDQGSFLKEEGEVSSVGS